MVLQSRQACSGGWCSPIHISLVGLRKLDGQDIPLYRADYNFRAVIIPAGDHTVRFKYSPISFRRESSDHSRAMLLLLGFAFLLWQRF